MANLEFTMNISYMRMQIMSWLKNMGNGIRMKASPFMKKTFGKGDRTCRGIISGI